MIIYLERAYDPPQHKGYRVLVDRLWPRGLSKEKLPLDEWCKALTPSSDLRKWFAHEPAKWPLFTQRYLQELQHNQNEASALLKRAGAQPLILLSATKDTAHTHTLILKDFLLHLG